MNGSIWLIVVGMALTVGGLITVGVATWFAWRRSKAERLVRERAARRARFARGLVRDLGNCEKGMSEVD